MRVSILTGFFLFVAPLLTAQENFQFSYSGNSDEVIEWVIPANDGNLILAGNTNSHDPGDGLIMKTDINGNILWSRTIGGQSTDEIVRIIACDDGGYVAIGNTKSYGQGDKDAWVTRITEDGMVDWSFCFGTYSADAARGIIQTNRGGLIVVGHEETFDVAFILALTSRGEIQWKREYFQDIVIWFNDVFEDEEGDLYFPGAINHYGFGIHDTFIMKTDSVGNFISCKYYGDYNNDSFRTIVPYLDGFLVVGDTWSYQTHQLGWMARLDSDLNIEKSVVVGNSDVNQYLESACLISNDIYVDLKLTDGNSYIVELDSSLDFQQSWQFNPGYSSYSSHLISQEDSSIVFSGSITDDQTHRKDIFLAKFHPGDFTTDCNMVPHSTYIQQVEVQSADLETVEIINSSVYESLAIESNAIALTPLNLCLGTNTDDHSINPNLHSDIQLYPNPASGTVRISGGSGVIPVSVVFYNIFGAKISEIIPKDNSIDVSVLKPGVYIAELDFETYIVRKRLVIY
jgi:hypothetical protein